jgi:hypothetical protein
MSACRSCDAPIRWATSEHGRKIPLDLEPYRTGPEDKLLGDVRAMLAEHRPTLVELGLLEPLEQAVAEYDRAFDPRGLFVLRYDQSFGEYVAIATTPDAFPGEPLFRSHFATCPQSDSWRR